MRPYQLFEKPNYPMKEACITKLENNSTKFAVHTWTLEERESTVEPNS